MYTTKCILCLSVREGDEHDVARARRAERALDLLERAPGRRDVVEDDDGPAREPLRAGDGECAADVFLARGVLRKRRLTRPLTHALDDVGANDKRTIPCAFGDSARDELALVKTPLACVRAREGDGDEAHRLSALRDDAFANVGDELVGNRSSEDAREWCVPVVLQLVHGGAHQWVIEAEVGDDAARGVRAPVDTLPEIARGGTARERARGVAREHEVEECGEKAHVLIVEDGSRNKEAGIRKQAFQYRRSP